MVSRIEEEVLRALMHLHNADVAAPYTLEKDGTLTVTVPKGTEVTRVLVQEDGTQWGGLYYSDSEDGGIHKTDLVKIFGKNMDDDIV